MKLIIVGQPTCRPCVQMKNQILDRINDLVKIGVNFEYVDLNSLDDKETFIQSNGLTATPTIFIEKDGQTLLKMDGYVDIETLFEMMEEYR